MAIVRQAILVQDVRSIAGLQAPSGRAARIVRAAFVDAIVVVCSLVLASELATGP
jgi:hypothetical protein